MQKEILVDTSLGEVRIAVVENGKLVELYLEHEDAAHYAGDIYKGRVEDVLPGLGSAFVRASPRPRPRPRRAAKSATYSNPART